MTSHDDDRDSLSRTLLERIVSLCDQFEQAWRAGDRPRIESFLTEIDNADALLERLLLLELDFRKQAGESPSPDDYRARFADSPTVINAVFAKETAMHVGWGRSRPNPVARAARRPRKRRRSFTGRRPSRQASRWVED